MQTTTPVDVKCDTCGATIPAGASPVLIGSRVMCDAFRCFGPTLADAGDTTAAALMQIKGLADAFLPKGERK